MFHFIPRQSFAFFAQQTQRVQPKKCCRYNQNGKPLSLKQVEGLHKTLKDLMEGWHVDELRLHRYFYSEDYLNCIEYIREIAKVDSVTTKNCPGFDYKGGELLGITLYSPSLNGLSQVDFELAMRINQIDHRKYYLIPLNGIDNYRQQVQAYRMKNESARIQEELKQQ